MKLKIIRFLDKISEWSLYILIFTLPFAKSIIEICIVTALISVILKKAILKEGLSSGSELINTLLLVFLLASLLSIFNTHYMNLTIRAFFSKLLKFAVLFLVTQEIINTKDKIKNLIIAVFLSCILISIDAFVQTFITHRDFLHNYLVVLLNSDSKAIPTASFPFPTDFAAWIIILIFPFITFSLFVKDSLRNRLASVLGMGCLLYLLMLSKVRGAWVGFLVAFGVLSAIKLKKVGVILIGLFLLGILFVNRSILPNVFSMASMGERSVIWKNSIEIFKRHPVIGNGINTYYMEYMNIRSDEYKGTHGSYAHNCYLQMAVDTGLIGLISFLTFIAAVLIKGFRSAKIQKDPFYYALILGINLGLIAFLIHSAVDTNLYSLPLAALFWMSAGLLMAVVKISGQENI